MPERMPFHLAIPVDDLDAALSFYKGLLGCATGRTSEQWIDFDFYGHQLVVHKVKRRSFVESNPVDGHTVPSRHFGIVMDMDSWKELRDRLQAAKAKFLIEPYTRFRGEVGEQATLFVEDPAGNALEFKGFVDMNQLFATN